MADIKLTRPEAGQYVVIPSTPDARMVLDFSADQVSIDRPQGSDSLFFRFEDGSSIELQNFYAQYSKEDIPAFEIDGQLIAGADFFNAFGPDLVPAAGPAASATRAARYADLTNSNLLDGVRHLDGLDVALDFGGKTEPILDTYASPFLLSNSAPSLSTGGGVISMSVTEAGVGKPHMAPLTGSFTASDPDGDSLTATVTMGGTSVAINGVTRVVNNYGTLIITPVGSGSNVTYQYSYEVNDNPVDPLFKATDSRTDGADSLAQGESHTEVVTITLRDSMGHVVTQSINITITGSNDAPDIRSFDDMTLKEDGHFAGVHGVKDATNAINPAENSATENGGTDGAHHLFSAVGTITAYDPDHGAVLTYGINTAGSLKDASGHDSNTTFTVESFAAPANGVPSPTSIQGCDTQIKTEYGTLYLNSSTGKYEFVVDSDSSATNKLAEGQTVTLSFMPTVTDEHGAVDNDFSVMRNDGTPGGGANGINITIMGSNDVPVIQSAGWTAGNVVTEDSNAYLINGKVVGTDVDANETSTLRYGFFHPDGSGSGSGTLENTLYVVASGTASDGSPQYSLSTSAPADGNFYGKLAIDQSSGNYSFELNNAASCVQALDNDVDKGSSLGVTFPVVVKDDFGAYSTQNVSLTINGVNDAPQFLSTGSASYAVTVKDVGVYAAHDATGTLNAAENDATLDGGVGDGQHMTEASGKIVINDVDNGDNAHTVWGVTTASGQVQVGAQSTAMGAGKATTTFYVLADDSVTTKSPNDNNYYGTLTVKDDGSYTFKANTTTDSPVDKLGETVDHSFTVKLYANDGQVTSTSALSITIKGSNDAPFIKELAAWDSKQDSLVEVGVGVPGVSKITGTWSVSDYDVDDKIQYRLVSVENGESKLYEELYLVKDGKNGVIAVSTPGVDGDANYYGKVSISDSNGKATYAVELFNNSKAVEELRGDGTTDKGFTFTVAAQDKFGAYQLQEVTGAIKGTDDAPSIVYSKVHLREDGVWNNSNDQTIRDGKDNGGFSSDKYHRDPVHGTLVGSDIDNAADELRYYIDTKSASNNFLLEGNSGMSVALYNGYVKDAQGKDVCNYTGEKLTLKIDSIIDTPTTDNAHGEQTIKTNYGTLVLDKVTGAYSFTLGGAANALAKGDTFDFQFKSVVTDPAGAMGTHILGVTIEGANDKPVLGFVDEHGKAFSSDSDLAHGVLGVTESGVVTSTETVAGYVLGTDPDAKASLKYGLATGHMDIDSIDGRNAAFAPANGQVGMGDGITTAKGSYGSLVITADGKYTYTLDSRADVLDDHDSRSENFTIYVRDEYGAWDAKQVSITVHGANDAPVILDATPLAVTESGVTAVSSNNSDGNKIFDGTLSAKGQISAKDVDVNDKLTYSVTSASGTGTTGEMETVADVTANNPHVVDLISYNIAYKVATGTLYLKTDTGQFLFELNDTAVEHLNQGDSRVVDFSFSVTDGSKVVDSINPIRVSITGTNDRPTLDFVDSNGKLVADGGRLEVTEAGYKVAGKMSDSGYVSGSDNDDNAGLKYGLVVGNVAAGDELNQLSKAFGVDPDTKLAGMGNGVTKVDGSYGSLIIDSKGQYTYTLDSRADALDDGDSRSESFTIYVRDEHGAWDTKQVSVAVHGTNDAPVIINATPLAVTESGVTAVSSTNSNGNQIFDGTLSAKGQIFAKDVDAHDALTYSVTSASGTGATGGMTIVADVTANNPHVVDSISYNIAYKVATGTLYLKTDTGQYLFELNDTAVEHLKQGDSREVDFSFSVSDGPTKVDSSNPIKVSITGTNDRPSLGFVDSHGKSVANGGLHAVTESGYKVAGIATATGYVKGVDSDDGAGLTYGLVAGSVADRDELNQLGKAFSSSTGAVGMGSGVAKVTGTYGTLSITNTGKYTYRLNNNKNSAADKLGLDKDGKAQTAEDDFTIYVRDEHGAWSTQHVAVTITGSNDAPVLTSVTAKTLIESGFVKGGNSVYSGLDIVNGSLTVTDVDVVDAGTTLKFAFNGVKIGSASIPSMVDLKSSNIGGVEYNASCAVDAGTLYLDTNTGKYAFVLDNIAKSVNSLSLNEKLSMQFSITVADVHGAVSVPQNITINITGSNDKPTLTLYDSSAVAAHTSISASSSTVAHDQLEIKDSVNGIAGGPSQLIYDMGTAKADDIDHNANAYFGAVKGLVSEGSGTLSASKILATAFNTIERNGLNSGTSELVVQGEHGKLHVYANGNYSYEMDATQADHGGVINKLTADQYLDDSFTILVKDEYGAWTTKPITVRIDGVNDAPYLTNLADTSGTVKESGNGYASLATDSKGNQVTVYHGNEGVSGTDAITGKFHVADDDSSLPINPFSLDSTANNVALSGADATFTTSYGVFHLNIATGEYRFDLNNSLDAVQALKQGDSRTVTIPIAVSDGNGGTLKFDYTLTVQGTNDKPALSLGTASLDVTDQTMATASSSAGNVTVNDPDDIVTGDSKTITYGIVDASVSDDASSTPATSTSWLGKWGTFSIDPKTGQYTYTIAPNNAAVICLGENDKPLSETFKVAVVDQFGAFSTKDVTVFIHGHDDTTFISSGLLVPNGAVTDPGTKSTSLAVAQVYGDEEFGHITVSGKIGATDADSTDFAALKTVSSNVLQYHIVINGNDYSLNAVVDGKPISINMPHGTLVVSLNPEVDKDGALFKYDYTVNTKDSAVEALTSKDPGLTDEFTVKVMRGTETEASSTATITIHGVNDRPTIEVTSASDSNSPGLVTEDTLLAIGKVVPTDPDNDHGGAFTFSLVTAKNGVDATKLNDAIANENPAQAHLDSFFNLGSGDMVAKGTYGYLVINQTGDYEYHRYPTNSSDYKNLNYLNTGESVNDTFYVRVRDEQGAYSQIKPVTVTLNGTNDKGSLENANQSVTELGVVQGSAFHSNELSFTDAKDANGNIIYLGANNSNTAVIKAEYGGKLSVHDDDNTGYTKFTPIGDLTIKDEHGSVLATFSGITVGKNTLKGYGDLTLDADGNYSFKPDQSSLNYLNVSNTLTLSLGVESTSSSTKLGSMDTIQQEKVSGNLSIAIHGTNDAPVVAINASGLDKNDFTTLSDGKTAIQYLTTHQELASSFLQHASDDMQSDFAKWLGAFVPSWGKSDAKWQAVWDNLEKKVIDSLVKSDKLDDFLSDLNQANAVKNYLHDKVDDNILVDTEVAKRDGTVEGLKVTGSLNKASIVTAVDNAQANLTFFAVDDKDSTDNVVKGSLVQHIQGQYGTLVLQADGNYTYMLNRESSAYQSLEKDAQESFNIYVKDPGCAVAEKSINLIVNVAPETGSGSGSSGAGKVMAIIDNATAAVIEDKITYVEGLVRKDFPSNTKYDDSLYLVDKSDNSHHTTISDSYGTITLLPDGSYTYILNNDNPMVQRLASGETMTTQYTVANASAQKSTITVTITGTNDAPYVLSEVKASDLYQDAKGDWHVGGIGGEKTSSVAGSFTVKDIDNGDMGTLAFADKDGKLSVSNEIKGAHGTYTLTSQVDGKFEYSYTPNDGDYVGKATDSVDVYISDQHGGLVKHTLSVTLGAENNAPDLTVEDLTVNEDSRALAGVTIKATGAANGSEKEIVLSGSNTLTYAVEHSGATSADGIDLATVPTNGLPGIAQGQYGTLLLNNDTHKYEYRLNNDSIKVQQLGEGQIAHDKFTVTVTDADGLTSSKVVDVTINGTNDVPSLSLHSYHDSASSTGTGASLYIMGNENNITVHGTAIGLDEDANDTGKLTYSVVAKDSSWEGKTGFVLDSGQLRLSQGGETSSSLTKQDVFIVEDSSGKWELWDGKITDAKIIHLGKFSLESTKDGNADYTFTGDKDGIADYTFTGDKDGIAHLGQGESFTVNAEVSVSDGHADGNASLPLQITVTGTNDAPKISNLESKIIIDNGTDIQEISDVKYISSVASDIDGDKLTYYIMSGEKFVTTLDNEHGSLTLDQSTGAYVFTMHKDYQADFKELGESESVTDTFRVVAVDSYGIESQPKDLNIILQGRNDAPIVDSYTASLNVTAHAGVSQSGYIVARDVDVNDKLGYTALLGEPTNGSAESWSNTVQGQYGSLAIDVKTGAYSYAVDSRAASLGLDNNGNAVTATEHFTVRVSDEHNGTVDQAVTVTVTGVNDAPTINSPTATLNVAAQPGTSLGDYVVANDADTADTLSYAVLLGEPTNGSAESWSNTVQGQYGSLAIDAKTGYYSYAVDSRAASLGLDNNGNAVTATEYFTVRVSDGHNGTVDQAVTVTVTGVNDAPQNLTVAPQTDNSGTLQATDVDAGDSLHYVIVQGDGAVTTNAVDGNYGHLDVNSSTGKFTYTAHHDSDAYKALAGGVDAADSFKVEAVDSAGAHSNVQELTFHVTGDNHAPVTVASNAELTVAADIVPGSHLSVAGDLAAAHDADNDVLTYSITGHNSTEAFTSGTTDSHTTILGEFGSRSFDTHNSQDSLYHYTYTLDSSEDGLLRLAAAHADGPALTDSFSYSVNDGHGGVTTSSLVVSLNHDSSANANSSIGDSDAISAHLLFGTDADDKLLGGASNDFLSGGEGDDTLYGGEGHDYLFGGSGGDTLDGGLRNDHLYGGTGNDHLDGGAGNDFLDGGTGTNILAGGDGNDILVHHDGDVISGGSGIDVLLTDNPEDDLSKLLDSSSDHSVEVAIKATDADPAHSPLSLTDSTKLAAVGISIDGTAMTFSEKWAPAADASSSGNAFNNANDHLALSTNLVADTPDSSSSTEVAKFILNNS